MKVVGRKDELSILERVMSSNRPEFLAIYGRRRVGKTYLIKEFFDYNFDFYITAIANSNTKDQLKNFYETIKEFAPDHFQMGEVPVDWFEAFRLLKGLLESSTQKGKLVVFFDELPWFDTKGSKFIQALEYFWNSYLSSKNIAFIVCGSAASWMIHNLIRSRGGLHNRLTFKLRLEPFTLNECDQFFKEKGAAYEKYQLVQLYMALGGIPFYLELVDTRLSAVQNIHELCFKDNGQLQGEFQELYRSLFKKADNHLAVVKTLSKHGKGLTRSEILKEAKLPNAGSSTRVLSELIAGGFVKEYIPFGGKAYNKLYQLVDFYSLFYLHFLDGQKRRSKKDWILAIDDPGQRLWSGYAFEMVCLLHIKQIKKALGISGVQTESSFWSGKRENKGFQIDLLIDRKDGIINLCEIKFSESAYTISKKYREDLLNKVSVFREMTKTKKSIFLTLITTYGLKEGEMRKGLIQNSLRMEDLFLPL